MIRLVASHGPVQSIGGLGGGTPARYSHKKWSFRHMIPSRSRLAMGWSTERKHFFTPFKVLRGFKLQGIHPYNEFEWSFWKSFLRIWVRCVVKGWVFEVLANCLFVKIPPFPHRGFFGFFRKKTPSRWSLLQHIWQVSQLSWRRSYHKARWKRSPLQGGHEIKPHLGGKSKKQFLNVGWFWMDFPYYRDNVWFGLVI